MKQLVSLILIASLCCFSGEFSYSQTTNEESAVEHVRNIYSGSVSEQSGLYDGLEYTGYPYPIRVGQPFFQSDSVTKGEVFYKGMLYRDVPMWYDLVKNVLVVLYLNNYSRFSLNSPKVDYFSVFNHHFYRIDSATADLNNIDEGFYDRIYKGRSEVIVKRAKGMLRTTNNDGIWISILNQKDDRYLIKDGRYYSLRSEKSVLKALGNAHAKEIQAELKKSKIKFRRDPEKALVLMVSVYDQLSK